MDPDRFCREVEQYLCRRNQGHLIRIVGPAFDLVKSWAEGGVPIKVVQQGIDRCVERYQAKGPRRRPVRIEFCEADVLDAFDDWRRAVGAWTVSGPDREGAAPVVRASPAAAGSRSARSSLPKHLERVVSRLLVAGTREAPAAFRETVEAICRELDALGAEAKTVRGEARDRLLKRLEALDGRLMQASREAIGAAEMDVLRREAESELEPFRLRMPAEEFARACEAAADRLLRERWRLPNLGVR